MSAQYEVVIGLEIHVQLRTKSKMFCRCENDAAGANPNQLTCPVCLGLPGALPVPNRTAVEWAIKAAQSLGCEIPKESKFDRKQYFYPDLPKGYQISQYDQPLGGLGKFEFELDGDRRKIGITRLHLEEDAGKLTHPKGADHSLVDLNRAGTPLVEIVTEPDFRSPAEAKRFLKVLRRRMRHLGVSDADMEKGHLRADANVSLRKPGAKKLGTKTEVKNLNSFKFVEKGLAAEIVRQEALLKAGEPVVQETRGYDESTGTTVSQRGKEEAHDYRYFPDPDLPPLRPRELVPSMSDPTETPDALEAAWTSAGVLQEAADMILESRDESNAFGALLERAMGYERTLGQLWLTSRKTFDGDLEALGAFVLPATKAKQDRRLSSMQMTALTDAFKETGKPVDTILKDSRFEEVDQGDLEGVVVQAIADNPHAVADFKAGNENARQAIVGAVMKSTKGAADAAEVARLVQEKLAKR